MDITTEDLLLVLKSVKDELVQEEQEAQKLKAAKEASESSSSETSDSSPAPVKKAAKEESESSESETSTEESKAKPFEKKKSADEVEVQAATEQEEPVDLYQTYVGLGQESIEDLKNHSIAANMALLAHAGQDMSNHWTAFKSAKEVVVTKSVDEQLAAEIESAKAFAAKTEEANQKLVEQNQTLEKSLKETNDKVAALTVKFAELAKQPQTSQAAQVKFTAPEAQHVVLNSQEIVKSLAEGALKDGLSDKDRELITRYTIRPKMTEELADLLKKIGSVK